MAPGIVILLGALLGVVILFGLLGWFLRASYPAAATIFFIIAGLLVVVPLLQWFVMRPLNKRYIADLTARSTAAKIVGRDYAYVVATLGKPSMETHNPASFVVARDGTRTAVGKPYTALRYWMPGYFITNPNFLVIIDDKGQVANFRYND